MVPGGIILIVEDSEPCVTTLEMALAGLDSFETQAVRNASEALALIAGSLRVRAIVTDLQLPSHNGRHIDGFDLIRQVRSRFPNAAMPILVTSGDSDPANSERLRNLGADAYFTKPYSPAALRRTLEKLLHAP
jgi:CheY-like chemotaxis protein